MHYQDLLANIGLVTAPAGQQPVHATYVIGLGLGMKESSGKYCEGWDVAADGVWQESQRTTETEHQRMPRRAATKCCLLPFHVRP